MTGVRHSRLMVLAGPTAGYLLGFLPAAWIAGIAAAAWTIELRRASAIASSGPPRAMRGSTEAIAGR